MSELHVRQIKASIEKHFTGVINLSDVSTRPQQEKSSAFLTRAQLAFVFSYLSGLPLDVAAMAMTDGFGDNGIDGALYNASERVLYLGQSKWRHDGNGSIDRGEIQKFIKGFRDLINARWQRFNDRMKARASEIEAALNDANTRIVLVVAYAGRKRWLPKSRRSFRISSVKSTTRRNWSTRTFSDSRTSTLQWPKAFKALRSILR